jgi:arylsulfatase A-like enzyme
VRRACWRGFERWYGFLGAETNQWYPDLVYDNHPVDQPRLPEEGYHFTEDPGEAPHRFTGGTISQIAIDVSGEAYVDLEREAVLMLMRE